MSQRRYTIDMTSGNLTPKLIAFAFPLMLTGLLQLIYNAADVMVVGRFAGSISLAAVGATTNLVHLILNVFIGLSTGSGVVVARHIGSDDGKAVHRTVQTSMLLSIVSGLIIAAIGFFLSPAILRLMSTPENVLPLSVTYLKIFFLGAPASMIYNFGSSILRATGDSKRPLYMLLVSGLLNVSLNLVFVIVFKMDVAGVALATIISQYLSAIFVLTVLIRNDGFTHLSIRHLRFYKNELISIIRIGLPAGIQGSLFSISNVIIQSSINSFGPATIAGNTASTNIDNIIYTCCNAVAQTSMTFSSQNLGAEKYKRVNQVYLRCLLITLTIGASLGFIFYTFSTPLLSIFSTDPQVIEKGNIRLHIFAVTYIINSLLDVTTGQLRGIGKSITPMIITLTGVCGLRVLWVYTVFRKYHTLEMLYYSYPVSWIITLITVVICYVVIFHKMVKKASSSKENINR